MLRKRLGGIGKGGVLYKGRRRVGVMRTERLSGQLAVVEARGRGKVGAAATAAAAAVAVAVCLWMMVQRVVVSGALYAALPRRSIPSSL